MAPAAAARRVRTTVAMRRGLENELDGGEELELDMLAPGGGGIRVRGIGELRGNDGGGYGCLFLKRFFEGG